MLDYVETLLSFYSMSTSKPIAILFGGVSEEGAISAASARNLFGAIDRMRYSPFLVELTKDNTWKIIGEDDAVLIERPLHDLRGLGEGDDHPYDFELALVLIHGAPAENGQLQSLLESQGIAYSCCSMKTSCLTFDKQLTKVIAQSIGVRCAKGQSLNREEISSFHCTLDFPVIVKPNESGSSYGVHKVDSKDALSAALCDAGKYSDKILVEEFIVGREVAVGLIQLNDDLHVFPITEIIPDGAFFDYEAKYEGKSQEITPANIDNEVKIILHDRAKKLYDAFSLQGIVRIDFFVTKEDVFLIEINTIPGMSAASIIPQQCKAYGWSLQQLSNHMIDATLHNHRAKKSNTI